MPIGYKAKKGKNSVAVALRNKARELTEGTRRKLQKPLKWDLMIPSMLKRELSLNLEQIDRTFVSYESAKESILNQECYLGTELLQLDTLFGYSLEKRPERERILSRLSHLEGEKRRLREGLETKIGILNRELLTLLERHAQLSLED